jgi:Bifunctional DNA primase/polymerase, N-terminal
MSGRCGVSPREPVADLSASWNIGEEASRRHLQRELDHISDQAPDEQNMQAAALWYAKNGIPVFPLHWPTLDQFTGGSRPSVSGIEIHEQQSCNFAGRDADVGGWPFSPPFPDLTRIGGGRLETVCCARVPRRPARRSHYWQWRTTYFVPILFRYVGGRVPKELAKGVDLKGDGGYLVAAPSLHASGRHYAFDEAKGRQGRLSQPRLGAAVASGIHCDRNHVQGR